MSHYKSNLRDIEFNLFEMLRRQDVMGAGLYEEFDEETARGILDQVNRLAVGPLAESFADSDRNPPVFDPADGSVRVPDSFRRSFRAYMDAELVPPRPAGRDRRLARAALPLLGGGRADPGLEPGGLDVLQRPGVRPPPVGDRHPRAEAFRRPRHRAQVGLDHGAVRAGRRLDVGARRTKATGQPDGTWHIEGVKRFITSGEQDMTENIFHLVLARPEGAGPGTKGLSMFLVPKFLVNDDGSPGERNGVRATNVEHKMGLKASTTCELTFGGDRPAVGTLVGGVHEGIRQMFKIIEHARMVIGVKAIGTLSTGYLNALEYAKSRVQGADLTQMLDKAAPRVTITHHPDVRRMLMLQKAYAEGMRALVLYMATIQDDLQTAAAEGRADEKAAGLNDLLLPVVKGLGSERAYEMLALSLQTFGGSGFLQDYPVEQYIRDAKIDSLYEGTTGIQGMDLYFRKIVRDGGQALGAVLGEIRAFAAGDGGNGRLKSERAALAQAADDIEAMTAALTGFLAESANQPEEIYRVGLNTRRGCCSHWAT